MFFNVRGNFLLRKSFYYVFISVVVFLWLFILLSYYLTFGEGLMPLGWDVGYYMASMRMVVENGVFAFVAERIGRGNFRILYPCVTAIFVGLGVDPAVVEIFFPIFLSVLLILLLSMFVLKFRDDSGTAVLAGLFSISWYGLYRLVSNYHANMLAIVFVLFAAFILLRYTSFEKRCSAYFLVFLASITHPLTSVFSVIFMLAMILLFLFERERRYIVDGILIFLSSVLSFSFLVKRTQFVVGVVASSQFFGFDVSHRVLVSLGVFLPIVVLGFLNLINVGFKKGVGDVRRYALFVSCWFSVSAIAGILYMLFPLFCEFERIMVLAPIPILMAEGVVFLVQTFKKVLRRVSSVCLLSGFFMAIVLSSTFLVYAEASIEFQAFTSYSGYQKLRWIAENMGGNKLVFIIYGAGIDSMLVGEVYNYLITAAVGDHYTFLGRVDFFLSFMRMSFLNSRGERYSRTFFSDLEDNGLLEWEALRECKIIVVDDFYLPHGLPSYYRGLLFDEVYDGVFLLNFTRFSLLERIYVPLYYTSENHTFGWYWIERGWSSSGYVAECYDEDPWNYTSFYEVFVPLPWDGDYVFEFRFLDGTLGCGFRVKLNGSVVGSVVYNGSSEIVTCSIVVRGVRRGVYNLVFELFGDIYFASLDYLMYELVGS